MLESADAAAPMTVVESAQFPDAEALRRRALQAELREVKNMLQQEAEQRAKCEAEITELRGISPFKWGKGARSEQEFA